MSTFPRPNFQRRSQLKAKRNRSGPGYSQLKPPSESSDPKAGVRTQPFPKEANAGPPLAEKSNTFEGSTLDSHPVFTSALKARKILE